MKIGAKLALIFAIPAASLSLVFLAPELKIIQEYFSIPATSISRVMSFYLLGYLAGQFIFSSISKKIGIQSTIQLGFSIAALALILQIFSWTHHDFDLFIFSRFLIAFGLSSGLVCGFAAIKETLSHESEKNFLTLIAAIFTVSAYASIMASGNLIKFISIPQLLTINLLYISLAFSLSFALNLKTSVAKELQPENKWDVNQLHVLIYALVISISTIFAYCYSLFAPFITMQRYHLTPTEFGNYNIINLVGAVLGSGIYKLFTNKITERRLIQISLLLCTICAVSYFVTTLPINHSLALFFTTTFIMNVLCGLLYPAATFKALEFGSCKRTSSAIMNTTKIAMPCAAIFFVNLVSVNPTLNLAIVICVSAISSSMLLLVSDR